MGSVDAEALGAVKYRFGQGMRGEHFSFADGYQPLNHGSFGTFPKTILEYQRQLQAESEARPDTFIRYTYLDLLNASRVAIAPLLGADPGEVVLVQNATTGVNTILRNLKFDENDAIIHFSTIYGACVKTIQSLAETSALSSHEVNITYPIDEAQIVDRFCAAVREVKSSGKHPKLAMFDTVLTFPGVRFPWEKMVMVCKEQNILSFIDAAHGVGHIDMTHLHEVGPDFMISNCYKWLMVPRGCAVLFVPFRNQKLISTTVPTSWGYQQKHERDLISSQEYFSKLFDKVSTIDNTPYCCIPLALRFRSEGCGGEASIRKYCFDLAKKGGARMAEMFGTEALDNLGCCFATVRLPLAPSEAGVADGLGEEGRRAAKWMQELTPAEYNTYIPIKFYNGAFWCRISAQIYLAIEDFEWAARTLVHICERAKAGAWR